MLFLALNSFIRLSLGNSLFKTGEDSRVTVLSLARAAVVERGLKLSTNGRSAFRSATCPPAPPPKYFSSDPKFKDLTLPTQPIDFTRVFIRLIEFVL